MPMLFHEGGLLELREIQEVSFKNSNSPTWLMMRGLTIVASLVNDLFGFVIYSRINLDTDSVIISPEISLEAAFQR